MPEMCPSCVPPVLSRQRIQRIAPCNLLDCRGLLGAGEETRTEPLA